MAIIHSERAVIQTLQPQFYKPFVAGASMLRLDLLHPVISGNKWFKLHYNIKAAQQQDLHCIVTFGGAYSNHLVATAYACKAFGIKAMGIVRGEDAQHHLNSTLHHCRDLGMHLIFVGREDYKRKNDSGWLSSIIPDANKAYVVPEGGANEAGRRGAGAIADLIPHHYSHIILSIGTGTTFAGLRNRLPVAQQMLGFIPIKGGKYIDAEMETFMNPSSNTNWQTFHDWHFGGFGKHNTELISFLNQFYEHHNIPLDFVYEGKMMYGLQQLLQSGFFPQHAQILCLHCGGLQGNASISHKLNFASII